MASPSSANWQASPWCCCSAPSAGWSATWPGWPVATSPRRTVVAALPGHHHRRRAAELIRFLPTPPIAQNCSSPSSDVAARRRARHRPPVRRRPGRPGAVVAAIRHRRRNIGTQGSPASLPPACSPAMSGWLSPVLLGLAGAFAPGHGGAMRRCTPSARFCFRHGLRPRPDHLPAVTRIKIPYHPALYLPLALLHLTLAVRVLGGLADHFALRQYAALTNGLITARLHRDDGDAGTQQSPEGLP